MPRLEELKGKVAEESTRTVTRGWYEEAQMIAEEIDDPALRWVILLTALRRIGWPKQGEDDV